MMWRFDAQLFEHGVICFCSRLTVAHDSPYYNTIRLCDCTHIKIVVLYDAYNVPHDERLTKPETGTHTKKYAIGFSQRIK